VVRVTDVATKSPGHARATPTPTRFVAPTHPFIVLVPRIGPPVSRPVRLIGGNFPKRSPVDMLWSAPGRASPMDTVIYTGPHGNIDVSYTVPASPPGKYAVTAEVNGVRYTSTAYTVTSHATLTIAVVARGSGVLATVTGRHFVPHFKLALVAYPTVGKARPKVLGMVRASQRGSFLFRGSIKRLPPGQYILRSWSVSDLAAQMAETSFEVDM
jgi:hypothetical protein